MIDIFKRRGASTQLKGDVTTIVDHDRDKCIQAHEYFTKRLETYLSEDNASTP